MTVFDLYSKYYDLLYVQKDYRAEARYVFDELENQATGRKTVLELGCGTGRHATELASLGYQVHGIDLSSSMLDAAKQRIVQLPPEIRSRLSFDSGDVRSYRAQRLFDAAISLFHVFSYQTSNRDLLAALATASAHIREGGLLAFDFWSGPAVLTQRPETRVRRLENAEVRVTRIAESNLIENENRVDVTYTVLVEDKHTGQRQEIHEVHPMRYFFLPELAFLLETTGFEMCSATEWLTRDPLSTKSWGGFVIARKVGTHAG